MFRKNRKTIVILQNISLYNNPMMDDKGKSGHEKEKILKQDLEYFWIKVSTLMNAGLSDLRGFVEGMNVCGTSQRDAMDQEKNPALFWCFIVFPV